MDSCYHLFAVCLPNVPIIVCAQMVAYLYNCIDSRNNMLYQMLPAQCLKFLILYDVCTNVFLVLKSINVECSYGVLN